MSVLEVEINDHIALVRLNRPDARNALDPEMLLTGKPIDAERALAAGLINYVADADKVVDVAMDLAAAIAAEFYRDGIWDHASYANDVLRVKRDLLLDKLAEELDDICAWSKPVGGLFVWVRIPDDVDRKKLSQLAQNRGFNYLPGVAFHVETKNVPYLRLAFGFASVEAITEGVPLLGECIQRARTSKMEMA